MLYKHRAILITNDEVPRTNRSIDVGAKYLVVSDLHIGFEERYRISGIQIESSIEAMVTELDSLVTEYGITKLIIAGDVKSGVDRILKSEWDNVPKFFSRLVDKCEVAVIPGNHDGGLNHILPERVELLDINGAMFGDSLILHGHTRPLLKFSDCKRVIVGHIHPILQRKGSPLSGKSVWVFLKVPRTSIFQSLLEERAPEIVEVVILPSFNLDLSIAGYSIEAAKEERRIAPIFKQLKQAKEAIITTLDGEVIGDESLLPNVF